MMNALLMVWITHVDMRMDDPVPVVKRADSIQLFVSQETSIVTITDADGAVGPGYNHASGTGCGDQPFG